MPKRQKLDRSPGKTGGVAYVHHDEKRPLTDEQVEIGKSISTDRRIEEEHDVPKGLKDRGD